jgi:two-component system response regulator AtoC
MTAERLPWICADPASLRLFELAQKVAPAPTTLLITGESGTGKDHLARAIHEMGPRRDAPYLKIDCASLPPQLVESELFGHEKGSFTGAIERKLGRFELGGAGTIVLDEVAALSATAQSKMLRVLQERTFERLGGTETLRIFRLNVLAIDVSPLRERRADILPLAEYLLGAIRGVHGSEAVEMSDATRRLLSAYEWPGNVRELRNALERAVVFSRANVLDPKDFTENIRAAAPGIPGSGASLRSLEEIEKEAIAATLEATHYKIGRAAEILGISRKTLLEKRKKYQLK